MKIVSVRKGWIENDVGYIPLTKGLTAIVDPDMVSFLEQWNWFAKLDPRSGDHYAGRFPSRTLGPRRYIHMARVILGMSLDGERVPDHINKNKLDNRKENLRPATNAENLRNRRLQSNSSTGLKGVYLDKRNGWYYARIKFNRKYAHLGCRRTAEEAYALYCAKAKELYGEFFCAG